MPEDATGVLTEGQNDPTVNPAQQNQTVTPPVPNRSDAEERIRALMSDRDKHRNAYEQQVAARVQLEQQLSAEKAERERVTNAAAQTTQQILDAKVQAERQLEQQRAETLKLQKLVQYPELREYAPLLPVTTDENVLNTAIAALLTARDRDIENAKQTALAAHQAAQPPTPPAPPVQQTQPQYPNNQYVPPIAPARPAPTAAINQSDPFQVQLALRDKIAEAYRTGDMSIFENAAQEAARVAAAQFQGQ